jgi:cell wall-associated NlpC family hydrolase
MTARITSQQPRTVTKAGAKHQPARAAQQRRPFLGDEMSTGRGRAQRSATQRIVGGRGAPPAGQDWESAFTARIAALERAVREGVPGAREELQAVLRDRDGVKGAITDIEQKLAANENPETWAKVKPPSRARAEQAEQRAQLQKQLKDLRKFGVKVAGLNPRQRQDLQNFFRMAKEDPEGLKRFIESQQQKQRPQGAGAAPAQGTGPVSTPATGAPANIQAAIDFGLSQLGAPYVGGASPFRFGAPGDGRTYQMQGQNAYVSPKGVVGYDCSGLMVTMLKKAGIDISNLASSRAMKANLPQVPKDQLQPGDLLVKNGHVAMYIGNGQMIEAVPSGVRVSPASKYINDPAYSGHRPG